MTQRTVTYQDIQDALHVALVTRGHNYIYPAVVDADGARACRYWHPEADGPGCIVGFVFHLLGATKRQLQSCEYSGSDAVMERLETEGWQFPERGWTRILLNETQAAQDNGATWSYAVSNATTIVSLRRQVRERVEA